MLVLVPTEQEAAPLREAFPALEVIGVGPVEAALRTSEILRERQPSLILLCGLAGAYPATPLSLGDLVLASEEIFGDLGLCFPVPPGFAPPVEFRVSLRGPWLEKIQACLSEEGLEAAYGPLVTVCCTSRDPERARLLGHRYAALAENMEGFAVARAARKAGVPLVELRAVSNLLENPEAPWDTRKALQTLQEALRCLARVFT